jgi:pimeloyl-ACP methyl ester carboxylesterase
MKIDSGGVGIEVVVAGPDDGPPVLLLHGFPDTGPRLWRHQIAALADAGYRVIVPDQRGYGASDKPADMADYNLLILAGDALAVLDALGVERAHVVGHDWGAAISWALASFAPDRVDHLVTLSVGHPAAFREAGLRQLEKSWYMLLFQFEGVAEEWATADGWANFREWSGHPDFDEVVAELESNGSLTPGFNWYRSTLSPAALVGPPPELPPVTVPTMGVWSTDDFALTEEQMTGSARHVSAAWRYERVERAGHWVQLEQPDEVNRLLLDFLPRG